MPGRQDSRFEAAYPAQPSSVSGAAQGFAEPDLTGEEPAAGSETAMSPAVDLPWVERRLPALVVLVVACALVAGAYWPGHMSSDSFTMWGQAVGREPIGDWHAPIFVMAWWLVGRVYGGVALIMLAGVAGMTLGVYGVLRVAFQRFYAALAALAVLVMPPVLSFVGVISRDVWFVDFLLLTVGCIRLAHVRRSRAWLALALLCLWFAVAARQNGVFTAFVFGAAVVAVGRQMPAAAGRRWWRWRPVRAQRATHRVRSKGRIPLRRAVAFVGWWLVAPGLVVIAIVVSQLALVAFGPVRSLHPEQAVYIYDLAGLSVRTDKLLLEPAIYPKQDLVLLQENWNPNDLGGLLFAKDPLVRFWLGPGEVARLRDRWLVEVRDNPVEWLSMRFDVFRRQSAIGQPSLWVTHPGIDPNPFGVRVRFEEPHEVLQNYLDLFIDESNNGNHLFDPAPYGVIGLLVAGVGLRRRWPGRLAGWLGLGVVVYTLTPLAPTTGATYRYSYFTVVGGSLCALVALRWVVDAVRARATSTVR